MTARSNGFQNVFSADGNVRNLKELIQQNLSAKDNKIFKKTFLIRSALFIILYILLIKSNASVITALPLIFLLIAVYAVSNLALRENIDEFKNSLSQIESIDNIK